MKDITHMFRKADYPDFCRAVWDCVPMRESDTEIYRVLHISSAFEQALKAWFQQELPRPKYFSEYYDRLKQCVLVDRRVLGLRVIVDDATEFRCFLE